MSFPNGILAAYWYSWRKLDKILKILSYKLCTFKTFIVKEGLLSLLCMTHKISMFSTSLEKVWELFEVVKIFWHLAHKRELPGFEEFKRTVRKVCILFMILYVV